MRTNIVIDDRLMDDALRLTGFKTKKQAVEAGLKMLVRLARQEEIRKLRGQIAWQGDLDEMRCDAWFWWTPAFGLTISVGPHRRKPNAWINC